jgi:hypothetical protein
MLGPDERRAVAARFRVAEDQVARDHLISHILAALPANAPDPDECLARGVGHRLMSATASTSRSTSPEVV